MANPRRWARILLASLLPVLAMGLAGGPVASAAPAYTAWFNWFDKASPGMFSDNVHILDPGNAQVTGTVSLGSTSLSFTVNPGSGTYVSFPSGTIGGPVRVDASAPVLASQRVTYFRSFSEVPALDSTNLTTDAWWPWYDLASPGMIGDNVHVLNPDPSATASVTIKVGAQTRTLSVGPGQEQYAGFQAGTLGGPVHLTSDHPVLATQRVQNHTSFNELPAMDAASAAKDLVSNWYDLASQGFTADNVHMVNPGATDAHVTVYLNTTNDGTFTVPARGEYHFSFPVGTIGGPLKLSSDQPILATQRVNYYDAFQEVRFKATAEAATDVWFNWYDDASPCFIGDNLHLTNPSTSATVNGQVSLPGHNTLSFSINPGQETIVNWPRGTIGGPVHISANGGVLVDKRVVICPPPPPPPPPVLHKIVVSLSQQHLWAYDNGHLLLETDVTTGRPELPTPAGTYHIFYKTSPYEMISPWPYGSPYWYPNAWVNWVLEFLQGGYFLHDAPWRSWFGPGSQYGDGTHGCVNVPNGPMLQLYNWAQLGDEVDIVN